MATTTKSNPGIELTLIWRVEFLGKVFTQGNNETNATDIHWSMQEIEYFISESSALRYLKANNFSPIQLGNTNSALVYATPNHDELAVLTVMFINK